VSDIPNFVYWTFFDFGFFKIPVRIEKVVGIRYELIDTPDFFENRLKVFENISHTV